MQISRLFQEFRTLYEPCIYFFLSARAGGILRILHSDWSRERAEFSYPSDHGHGNRAKRLLLKREWGMGNGEWGMGNGEWGMENGKWGMGNGEWGMGNGEWGMGNGEWEMENGEWGMGNGEWGMGNREWGIGNGE